MVLKKIDTATELWQITHNWLLLSGNKPNAKYCREEITTHPDYPAMTSVTDFLESGNMAYNAVQADASYIHEFNYPLLAHTRKPGQEYVHIIPNVNAWDQQKEITKHWSGIVIFPEENAHWYNEHNSAYQSNAFKNKLFATALIFIGLGLFITSAFYLFNPSMIVFGLLSFIGLVISVFLLGAELGYQSQIVKQICGTVTNGGCEKVLKSNYAKGLLGITPADASLLYFGTQFIIFLLGSIYPNLLPSIFLVAFAGVAIGTWSIYTQAIKLKQWCALCLVIVGVLILQTITAILILNTQYSMLISAIPFVTLATTFVILLLALLPIKQLVKTNNSNHQKLTELKKWKTDANLFITQWRQEQQVDSTIWENDLVLGNPAAPILITVACNPYCGPCAKAHLQLDNLLHRFASKVKVQMRFLFNKEDEKDELTIAVKAILQKAKTIDNNTELQQMLTDWFMWMDFEKWNEKWMQLSQSQQSSSFSPLGDRDEGALQQHALWIQENNIAYTPTFFINGHKLPGRYNLNDIEILIPQLTEIVIQETVK